LNLLKKLFTFQQLFNNCSSNQLQ